MNSFQTELVLGLPCSLDELFGVARVLVAIFRGYSLKSVGCGLTECTWRYHPHDPRRSWLGLVSFTCRGRVRAALSVQLAHRLSRCPRPQKLLRHSKRQESTVFPLRIPMLVWKYEVAPSSILKATVLVVKLSRESPSAEWIRKGQNRTAVWATLIWKLPEQPWRRFL